MTFRLSISLSIFLTVTSLCGCASAESSDGSGEAINSASSLCQSDGKYSDFTFGENTVRIYEPDDSTAPEIWQGPVCILDMSGQTANCGFDLSLVKGVRAGAEVNQVIVDTFSGSNSQSYVINMGSCSIAQD